MPDRWRPVPHYWARELTKLGHTVRLMPAKDMKAYVRRNKNDAADVAALRADMAELGIVAAQGHEGLKKRCS
jgi:transposase